MGNLKVPSHHRHVHWMYVYVFAFEWPGGQKYRALYGYLAHGRSHSHIVHSPISKIQVPPPQKKQGTLRLLSSCSLALARCSFLNIQNPKYPLPRKSVLDIDTDTDTGTVHTAVVGEGTDQSVDGCS